MALSSKSLFVYNLQVDASNSAIDFKKTSGGTEINATLNYGFYSVTSLALEIARAMNAADPTNTYSVSVNRSVIGGTENRITISTNGIFLSLLFGTGSRAAASIASTIGFNGSDYTGATSYSGFQTCGTALIPNYIGYTFLDSDQQSKIFGAVNVSAAGVKEAVVFNIQKFISVIFKYEPISKKTEWKNFWYWAIKQRPFDFTPEINNPTVVYQVTLEKTQADGKGLAFTMTEMLPQFPNHLETGLITMRVVEDGAQFI